MRHVVAEAAEAGAVFEAGEDELVDDDDGKARQRDLKRLVVEQRDTQQRQREQDEVDGYSEHKDWFDHNVLEWPAESEATAGTVHYFSAFSQPAISLTATLACCSSLPMVKKPWNWPGKCR